MIMCGWHFFLFMILYILSYKSLNHDVNWIIKKNFRIFIYKVCFFGVYLLQAQIPLYPACDLKYSQVSSWMTVYGAIPVHIAPNPRKKARLPPSYYIILVTQSPMDL